MSRRGARLEISPDGAGRGCRAGQVVGVGVFTLAGMDIAAELLGRSRRMSKDPLPASWRNEPALRNVASFGELLQRLRRLDVGSDESMRALARLAAGGEPEVCLVVTAALLPLLIARCDRRRDLVAEAVPELASRVSEPAADRAPGVANRLLRRVVWRVQHDHGRRDWQVPCSEPVGQDRPHGVGASVEAAVSFEEPTVDRLALVEFQRRLEGCPRGADAWGLMVRAASPPAFLSSTERSRLAEHRRRLRAVAVSSLVA